MHFLLHGGLSGAVGEALRAKGHQTHDVAELELPPVVAPEDVLQAAQKKQWDIVTADAALCRAPYEAGVRFTRCIVYLQLEGGEVEQDDAVDRLFERHKRLTPGRLYTVTEKRVKVRQLPARPARRGEE